MRVLEASLVNTESSSKKRLYVNLAFVGAFVVLCLLLPIVFGHRAHANIIIGDGGGAGGGSGGAQTSNGWGWYNYSVDGNPHPQRFRNGSEWANVSSLCRNIGSDRVIAFIVLTVKGTDASKGVVYDYKSSWDNLSNYRGNAGGGWMPTASAKALYDSLSGNKSGYTWGSNVAWFCYATSRYDLTPAITGSPTAIETGSIITLQPSVNNTGQTASSNTRWEVNRFILNPGVAIPGGGNSSSNPVSYFGNGASLVTGASGNANFARGVTPLTVPNQQAGDYAPGTRICFALSVNPQATGNTVWRHSTPFCVIVGKKPKVQVWGGDLWVGPNFASAVSNSNVRTSTTVKNGYTFGSWTEYGILAAGTIRGTASGSAYAGNGLINSSVCQISIISFTNARASGCSDSGTIGNYGVTKYLPNVAASFPITSSTPTFGTNDLSNQARRGVFTATGNLTVNGGTLQSGRWVVINAPNANVRIAGNISYAPGPYSSIGSIPQLIIIARNITIADSVTNVDAWLVARGANATTDGKVNTCEGGGENNALTISNCSQQLVINGPIIAQKLFLRRTFGAGSGADSGTPAEIINLRPDSYLWGASQAANSGRLETVYSRELPPRY